MGLFWSMKPEPSCRQNVRLLKKDITKPIVVDLSVLEGHLSWENLFDSPPQPLAIVNVLRWYKHKSVRRERVVEGNVRGAIFTPPGTFLYLMASCCWYLWCIYMNKSSSKNTNWEKLFEIMTTFEIFLWNLICNFEVLIINQINFYFGFFFLIKPNSWGNLTTKDFYKNIEVGILSNLIFKCSTRG